MATVVSISQSGSSLIERFSDGSVRWWKRTTTGMWVPSKYSHPVVPGGAGETSVDNSGGGGAAAGTVAAPSDDYPWPNAPEDALSPLRYSYRDCTDFVAWRINRDNGHTSSPWPWNWGTLRYQGPGGNGDAIGWKHDWELFGWNVDITPVAGCIGWKGTSAGAYGHVAYVQAVSGGSLVIEEYNWGGTQAYNTRNAATTDFDSFLAMPH